MTQNRFKSPVVWTAVVSQIVSILIITGLIDTTLGDIINASIAGILQILVIFGFLNNPTDSEKF